MTEVRLKRPTVQSLPDFSHTKTILHNFGKKPQYAHMLARVFSAALSGIEAFQVEVEVNSGNGDTMIVIVVNITPKAKILLF